MSVAKKARTKLSEEDLNELNKEELILRVQRLSAHNSQLKNVISKKFERQNVTEVNNAKRKFDFTKYPKRHIFLRLLYLGWDYQGYATQEDTNKTIEWELFEALRKSCLIEDRTTSNYHRCGRTDKGVSAFGQVISLDVRSKILKNDTEKDESSDKSERSCTEETAKKDFTTEIFDSSQAYHQDTEGELEYCKILNRLLPPTIRAIAWCPVPPAESARFNCKRRTYKYFFPRGNLDLKRMADAAKHLVGEHDYRNLCKMDVANGVVNFKRKILSVTMKVISGDLLDSRPSNKNGEDGRGELKDGGWVCRDVEDLVKRDQSNDSPEASHISCAVDETESGNMQSVTGSPSSDENKAEIPGSPLLIADNLNSKILSSKCSQYDMCELTIVGQAFLWHQIRCIVTVLFLVGQGKEDPSVVESLLNVEKHPRKPQYSLASEVPLNLFASEYESSLNWEYHRETIFSIIKDLQKEWTMLSVRSSMVRQMLSELEQQVEESDGVELTNCLMQGVRPRSYIPLLQRDTCESLEDRIDHYVKRNRLDLEVASDL